MEPRLKSAQRMCPKCGEEARPKWSDRFTHVIFRCTNGHVFRPQQDIPRPNDKLIHRGIREFFGCFGSIRRYTG